MSGPATDERLFRRIVGRNAHQVGLRRRAKHHDESAFTDWGNTRGWNVMPGADTWSAKEYKGHIYAGDMTRGFDVFDFSSCSGVSCVALPAP